MASIPCYVTGSPNTQAYTFGNDVILHLSQEAFAHFILRAGKDEEHQNILDRAEEQGKKVDEFLALKEPKESKDPEGYIGRQLDSIDLHIKSLVIMKEKAESGLRILKALKKEWQETGTIKA